MCKSEVQEKVQKAIRDLNSNLFTISSKLNNRQLKLAIEAKRLLAKILEGD